MYAGQKDLIPGNVYQFCSFRNIAALFLSEDCKDQRKIGSILRGEIFLFLKNVENCSFWRKILVNNQIGYVYILNSGCKEIC